METIEDILRRIVRQEVRAALGSDRPTPSGVTGENAYLDIDELANEMGVSKQTLYRWRSEGTDMPEAFRVGSRLRWSRSAVDEWLDSRAKDAANNMGRSTAFISRTP